MLWRIGRFGDGRCLFPCVICLTGGQREFKASYCQVFPLHTKIELIPPPPPHPKKGKFSKVTKKCTIPSRLLLQSRMFVCRRWDVRPSFILKCLTCIFWFALRFAVKPRLTPGKQCSLLMGLGGVCVCTKAGDSGGWISRCGGLQRHVSFNHFKCKELTGLVFQTFRSFCYFYSFFKLFTLSLSSNASEPTTLN